MEILLSWIVDVAFRNSSTHGIGVFAKSHVPAGTKIWQYDESMRVCDADAMAALNPRQLRYALHGGYLHKPSDRFLWYTDGMQYMNHATTPRANIGLGTWPPLHDDHTVALRDIAPGEELLEDYAFWADGGLASGHWLYPLYLKHCPEHFSFLSSLGRLAEAA
jgi:SET domain-containing protein